MNLDTCVWCDAPVAWLDRTTGGSVCLDLDPVPTALAHPDAPLYALTRAAAAVPVRLLHKPPADAYLAHRCPQRGDQQLLHQLVAPDLEDWLVAVPPAARTAARTRLGVAL